MKRYSIQQCYYLCMFEKPNFKGEIENNFHKNPNFQSKKIPEWFGLNQTEAIPFQNGFHDKSAQTVCSKDMWVPILKGLKHLNTVLKLATLENEGRVQSVSWKLEKKITKGVLGPAMIAVKDSLFLVVTSLSILGLVV